MTLVGLFPSLCKEGVISLTSLLIEESVKKTMLCPLGKSKLHPPKRALLAAAQEAVNPPQLTPQSWTEPAPGKLGWMGECGGLAVSKSGTVWREGPASSLPQAWGIRAGAVWTRKGRPQLETLDISSCTYCLVETWQSWCDSRGDRGPWGIRVVLMLPFTEHLFMPGPGPVLFLIVQQFCRMVSVGWAVKP